MFPAVYKQAKRSDDQRSQRYRRLEQRRLGQALQESMREANEQMEEQGQIAQQEHEQERTDAVEEEDNVTTGDEMAEAILNQTEVRLTTEQGVQTEDELINKLQKLEEENADLRKRLDTEIFSVKVVEGNDHLTRFYTGLPAWVIFLHLFNFLSPFLPRSRALSLMDEFFLTLMRLRLNLMLQDLACRFRISSSTASRIFLKWLDVMYVRLKFLVAWPPREIMEKNMPMAFKQLYPRCRCIIDCSEIYIETPTSFDARAQTYSNYKKHNTLKFLIRITPCGTISFLSKCWGGRVSDKNLTQESGFLEKIEPGDVILADRGFTVRDDIAIHGGQLEIPAFTKGKKQLSQEEVEMSKQLAHVRIHVERVIGLLKNKYTLLKGPIPIPLLQVKDDSTLPSIDKIICVCSALTNLSDTVVPF